MLAEVLVHAIKVLCDHEGLNAAELDKRRHDDSLPSTKPGGRPDANECASVAPRMSLREPRGAMKGAHPESGRRLRAVSGNASLRTEGAT